MTVDRLFRYSVRKLIRADKGKQLTPEFIEDFSASRSRLDSLQNRLLLVNLIIILALYLSTFGTTEIQIFGLTIKSVRSFREYLLLIFSGIVAFQTITHLNAMVMQTVIDEYLNSRFGKGPMREIQDLKLNPFNFGIMPLESAIFSGSRRYNLSGPGEILYLLSLLLMVLALLAIVFGVMLQIQVRVIYDVFANPSAHPWWSYATGSLAILIDVLSIFVVSGLHLFPHKAMDRGVLSPPFQSLQGKRLVKFIDSYPRLSKVARRYLGH